MGLGDRQSCRARRGRSRRWLHLAHAAPACVPPWRSWDCAWPARTARCSRRGIIQPRGRIMNTNVAQDQRSVAVSVGIFAILAIVCVSLLVPPLLSAAQVGGRARLAGTPHVWKFHRILGVRTVELSVGWTACNAGLGPSFRKYVSESRGRATITIFERAREIPPGAHCVKSRGKSQLRVRLDRPVQNLDLFDGSSSPPVLRLAGHNA
jgi:hypothetical protein